MHYYAAHEDSWFKCSMCPSNVEPIYQDVSDFDSSFEFTNNVKNMKLKTFELLSACCNPVPTRTKHVQSTWEDHFTI